MRFFAIAASAWGLLLAISHVVRIAPMLPLWATALAIAAAVETLLFLYRYEAGAVTAGRARALVALRLLALAVLIWILIEPVWVRKVSRETQREVVVVMDDSGSMQLVDDGAEKSRTAIGQDALDRCSLVKKLGETMHVRVVQAARSVRGTDEKAAAGWSDSTDLAAALSTVLEQVPPDDLAGVVMVSDGRHNRPERVEDVARRFGILDAPVGIIAVGSEVAPRDAAVLSVRAPEAIHLGDRMRVTAELKFDGFKGKAAKVLLKQGEKVLETREVAIPQDHHREEVRFAQVPEDGGVNDYQIEIAELEAEKFAENNRWDFETSITDARTNVLIVEAYPRWEFRYLRNLFYGRDKSVHLQYVLMNPDQISYQENAAVPASAARPFGDALATRLPASEEEWRKFDVIILGDVNAKAVSDDTWKIISRCVNERGALLVMIAGPRTMPHAIASEAGRALVPAELEFSQRTYFNEGGEPFRWGLTAEGQNHPVTRQSDGGSADASLWAEFPTMMWRHPVTGVKEGAEVLLTADSGAAAAAVTSNAGLANALNDLAKRREREAKAALLVARQTGKGKVALLLTDRTWRLREGAGDLHHHRFWGNLVRWGAGPVLRSGGTRARLGTDQLTYTPDDRPKVTARLRTTDLAPVEDAVVAEILSGEKVISTVPLVPVKDSNGLYEATLERFSQDGKYEVRLRGPKADALIREDGATTLTTGFQVVGTRGPVELAETTLNRPLLETIASLSGGKVVAPEQTDELAALFLTDQNTRDEIRESSLWDNGWVIGLLALLLGSEWVLRRAGGLP
ncbi:MAG: hypothetical protein V4640_09460 [Verrucomicrobiota bacterium]